MDDVTEPQPVVDWKQLYDKSEHSRSRSRRAFTLSAVALALVIVLVIAGFANYLQQRQVRDVLNTVKAVQTANACRAELAADNESATTEFFTAIITLPVDRDRISLSVARLNQIVTARKDPQPCHALALLPSSAKVPTPVPPVPPSTTTTVVPASTTKPSNGGVTPAAANSATPTTHVAATATCKDGTPSFSLHRTGTCSGHGGVSVWLTPKA